MEDFDDAPTGPDLTESGKLTISPVTLEYPARSLFDAIVRQSSHDIVERLHQSLDREVRLAVHHAIEQQVGTIVSTALDGQLQPTNEWGEPKGAPVTLRDMIVGKAANYLGAKVDKEGRESTYNADRTRVEFVVAKQVEAVFTYQMQKEVKTAAEQAVAQAKARVGQVVGDLLVKLT